MSAAVLTELRASDFAPRYGIVRSVSPGLVEASGPDGLMGELCTIEPPGEQPLLAEIIAINQNRVLLSPLESVPPVPLGARVVAQTFGGTLSVGDSFAGRAINCLGETIDGGARIRSESRWPLHGVIPSPMERAAPLEVVHTGLRAIDGLLTLGKGQRVGIVAASGVGKTSLVEQLALQTAADHVILCLVGERGREVQSFWKLVCDRTDSDRFTLVAATSDESAARRARAPSVALAHAEYWRSRGRHVLLLVDSVTRLAMALREIGLAAGAPPTVRAYTPNVFTALPRLVERCGALASGGAISAIMTVLSETDDADDPIVELMKSLLDGHIVLSRTIAEQGRFPAIDVTRSVSRGLETRLGERHRHAVRDVVAMLAAYEESRLVIETGAYRTGTNPLVDRAISRRDSIHNFLTQDLREQMPFEDAVARLVELAGVAP